MGPPMGPWILDHGLISNPQQLTLVIVCELWERQQRVLRVGFRIYDVGETSVQ